MPAGTPSLKEQVLNFTIYGQLIGPQVVIPGLPNLISTFIYPQAFDILGYQANCFGFTNLAGAPAFPPADFPVPFLCAAVIGTQAQAYNLQTPPQGSSVSNVLVALQGDGSYLPANNAVVPARPEIIMQSGDAFLMFPKDQAVRVPANTPVSLYMRLSNVTAWDGGGFSIILYAQPSQNP